MAVSTVRTQALRTILFFGALIGAVLLAVQAAALRGFVAGDPGWTTGVTGLAFLVAGILVGARLHRTRFDRGSDDRAPQGVLTERELEVLRGIAAGHTNREIAENHFRSINTVKTQVAQIYAKLGVGGRVQAVERARDLRLLE